MHHERLGTHREAFLWHQEAFDDSGSGHYRAEVDDGWLFSEAVTWGPRLVGHHQSFVHVFFHERGQGDPGN